ncbi:polyhydroxyalkanoic acid system family protein [Curvibacter sp. HBC61]|uniref:Polyhydroxyalkanoic acid system family protein n=1 Tax=Curvibacter cyanobacteriorum TaxID=3026422 RepID=A0ABT5N1P0_9BURK|nr:polyhydroxyalkanoic acid system family protein [Curvibacter sp. HBC61]MDD0840222.1 polyhydroxyalkanoic acid system family protein [Curvibacter sp. HBC61]
MPDIHIQRAHALGLSAAREVARRWAEKAERKLDMQCRYDEGAEQDVLSFTRAGASGSLQVTAQGFELNAKLGFLLGSFQPQIEAEISRQLDELIKPQDGVAAVPTAPQAGAA